MKATAAATSPSPPTKPSGSPRRPKQRPVAQKAPRGAFSAVLAQRTPIRAYSPEPSPGLARPDDDRPLRSDPGLPHASLAAFQPLPPALCPLPSGTPAPTGSAQHHAEVAALAERMVTSLRVGRVGRRGHEVHMRLRIGAQAGLDIQLRAEGDRLTVVLRADSRTRAQAERIARRLETELEARGVSIARISVELD